MMLYPANYFMPISGSYRYVSHFKSGAFCELFSGLKNSRKLIARVFSAESAVIDGLHYDVRGNPVR